MDLDGKEIIVFGASENGKCACDYFSKNNHVLFVCDNDEKKHGKYLGDYIIMPPSEIVKHKSAIVVIAIVKRYADVVFQLYDMGVCDIWQYVEYNNLVNLNSQFLVRNIPNERKFKMRHGSDTSVAGSKGNVCKKKNVIIFANYFPPVGGGGVQRPLKFAKYLKQCDYNPIVITKGNNEKVLSYDYGFLDELDNVEVVRIQDTPSFPEELSDADFNVLENLFYSIGLGDDWIKKYVERLNTKWEMLPDNDVTWILYCITHVEEYIDLNNVSIVFTTIGPYSSALFGAYLKLFYGVKWVQDYRDPWCLNSYNMNTFYGFRKDRLEYEKELELSLLRISDYVVATSEVYCEEFAKNCPNIKTCCITNGYDEDDFKDQPLDDEHNNYFVIMFNGYIYENFELEDFIRIINELIEDRLLDKNDIQIVFNGSNPMSFSSVVQADEKHLVRYMGYLSHKKSIEKLLSANILLLYGSFGEGAYSGYTGKIFEYLRTGIPILSISSPYGVHYEMIEKQNRGITATMNDKNKIKKFIVGIYNEWKLGNKTSKELDDYVRTYDRKNLTAKLASVFDEIL